MLTCTLCGAEGIRVFQTDAFLKCGSCDLVSKRGELRLNPEVERARYLTHENTLENKGYLRFLAPVVECLTKRFPKGAAGLDFGCGPAPVLATLLERAGFPMKFYDPFFFPSHLPSLSKVDFVTCTEAGEHFFYPRQEFNTMFGLLKERGTIVLMTELVQPGVSLADWYYTRDPSHVTFYSDKTFEWIANAYNVRFTLYNHRIAVFEK